MALPVIVILSVAAGYRAVPSIYAKWKAARLAAFRRALDSQASARAVVAKLPDSLLKAEDEHDKTPIVYAASSGREDVVKLLFDRAAAIDGFPLDYEAVDAAVEKGHAAVVSFMLANRDKLQRKDIIYHLPPPLCIAVENGHIEVVRVLVENGEDINRTSGWDRASPLDIAAAGGHTEIESYLRKHGAKPVQVQWYIGMLDSKDEGERKGAFGWLYKRAKTMPDDPRMAAFYRHNAAVEGVAAFYGCNPREALEAAAVNRDKVGVLILLENGISTEAATRRDLTALHYAAAVGDWDIASLLIERGANVNDADHRGDTPLDYAEDRGLLRMGVHGDMVALLRQHGAKTGAELRAEAEKNQ
jgi:ankyrin repeat protein